MADNEIEEAPQDEEKSEGEGNEEKPSFLKSKLFIIIAGVVVLLILAGGGYYFFVATEEVVAEVEIEAELDSGTEETAAEAVEEDILNEENDIDPMAEQLGFEEASASESDGLVEAGNNDNATKTTSENSDNELIEMQQENVQMKQQISDLKDQMSQIQKTLQQQQQTNPNAQTKPLAEQNSFDYRQDYGDSPRVREPSRIPPPKPSWGDFERLNE